MGRVSLRDPRLASKFTGADYVGNYVLVLDGSCVIDSVRYGENTLVVATTIEPQPFTIAAPTGETCLAMALSF